MSLTPKYGYFSKKSPHGSCYNENCFNREIFKTFQCSYSTWETEAVSRKRLGTQCSVYCQPSPLTGSSTVWAAQLHSVLMQILKAITLEKTSLMHKDLKSFELKECFYFYLDIHQSLTNQTSLHSRGLCRHWRAKNNLKKDWKWQQTWRDFQI